MTDQQIPETGSGSEQQPITPPVTDRNRIAMEMIPVEPTGTVLQNFLHVADRARWMAQGRASVPAFLKGNIPDCIAIVELAVAYGFQPVQIARMAYEVGGTMSFMAQLHHAILNKSGLLKGRMNFTYEGEGAERRCAASGTFRGAMQPSIYTTPRLADIQPKNSPLWRTDPDQQMSYLALSRWVKRYCPESFLGVPMREEMIDAEPEHQGPDNAKDVTPNSTNALHERLKAHREQNGGQAAEGFRPGVVEAGLRGEGDLPEEEERAKKQKPAPAIGKARERVSPLPPKRPRGRPKKRTSEARTSEETPIPDRKPPEIEKPEAKAQEPVSPTQPAPAKAQDEVPPLPRTVAEYEAHVARWLIDMANEQAIEEKWRSEQRLRNLCQLIEEDRIRIRAATVNLRIAELRRSEEE